MFHLGGIIGSLRAGSYNAMLMHTIQTMLPDDMELEIIAFADVPLYNQDLDGAHPPEPAQRLRSQIAAKDGLIICTPEYNYSIPGGLKNAIDWASRPPATSALRGKPIALFGASTGSYGTVRAQLALRQSFIFTRSVVVNRPEVMIMRAQEKFSDGRLSDEPFLETVRKSLDSFVRYLRNPQLATIMAEP